MRVPRHPDGITPKIPMQSCPQCGYDMNAATATLLKNRAPKAGDVTFCFNCGHMMLFDSGLMMVEITPEVWSEMHKQRGLIRQVLAIQARIRAMGEKREGRA